MGHGRGSGGWVAVAVVGIVVGIGFGIPEVRADPPAGYDWHVFPAMTDDFEGQQLNTTKWLDHNPEWQGRLPGLFNASNVKVSNGTLQLWARNANITDPSLRQQGYANFTTSAVQSTTLVRYGYFEIRSRVGTSRVSSSFWFYHNNGTEWTEIDVFEMTGENADQPLPYQDTMHTHIFQLPNTAPADIPAKCHCQLPTSAAPQQPAPTMKLKDAASCQRYNITTAATPFDADFHVFSLLWTPTVLEYAVDGAVWWSIPNYCMHQPLTLNFDRETMPDWFGLPEPTHLPDRPFEVDYVHAWQASRYPQS
ncbi:uncharacterized protein MONBRDRAFT_37405 [Monosiga brevicollis MX1]|uniref:GH16 domain-containing protein n=1 Tax=Monosiga brevicollis TaxID=81824 RepID=A9V1J8_MONBE|nr:uncharacterized protein MONBRDRAFT_37405 [Monosiga brevicollis MX1]EDQ88578.1 predicted protein [Monosiga brevicollis MX1]|eukprot:XP_001746682.1 hypothetical protein [Monosiga brevicollis MX1]